MKKKVGRPRRPDTEVSGRAIYQRKWREDLKKYGMTRREKQAWDEIQAKEPVDPEKIREKIQEAFGVVKETFNFKKAEEKDEKYFEKLNKQEESNDRTSDVPSEGN
tara:strand:- start:1096 stop:1413 length:318 start_codon:yes stop_codon:yes gene_type:complete